MRTIVEKNLRLLVDFENSAGNYSAAFAVTQKMSHGNERDASQLVVITCFLEKHPGCLRDALAYVEKMSDESKDRGYAAVVANCLKNRQVLSLGSIAEALGEWNDCATKIPLVEAFIKACLEDERPQFLIQIKDMIPDNPYSRHNLGIAIGIAVKKGHCANAINLAQMLGRKLEREECDALIDASSGDDMLERIKNVRRCGHVLTDSRIIEVIGSLLNKRNLWSVSKLVTMIKDPYRQNLARAMIIDVFTDQECEDEYPCLISADEALRLAKALPNREKNAALTRIRAAFVRRGLKDAAMKTARLQGRALTQVEYKAIRAAAVQKLPLENALATIGRKPTEAELKTVIRKSARVSRFGVSEALVLFRRELTADELLEMLGG